MKYRSLRARAVAMTIALGVAFVASIAHADIVPCGGVGPGGPSCPPVVDCTADADCFLAGLGRCALPMGGGSGVCATDCNSLFLCNSLSDCPVFGSLAIGCTPTSIAGTPGICTYRDMTTSRPAVTVCTSGAATATQVLPCFNAGGNWALGDCDGDLVPNGVDANPCSATVTTRTPSLPSPFCLGGHICEGTSAICAPLLRCSAGSSACADVALSIGGTAWECSALPVAPTVSFCHPSCNATAHCSSDGDCTLLGTCQSTAMGIAMCLPSALSSCAASCSSNPLNWASAQGDCDGDGQQNGCDLQPCMVATGSMCTYNHLCSVDAGVGLPDASIGVADASVTDASRPIDAGSASADAGFDAASTEPDAALAEPDAAITQPDAAMVGDGSRPMDAATTPDSGSSGLDTGNTAMDANTGPGVTPGLGFGGGGGCRCVVGGGSARDTSGVWLGVGVALVALARRRRPTRR